MPRIPEDQFMRLLTSTGQPPHLEHGPAFDAVFDPFEFESEEFYRYYDASIECWMIGRAVRVEERVFWAVPEKPTDGDRPEYILAANALSFMPAPRLPAVLDDNNFRGPFWHGKRRFFWILTRLEQGWRLTLSIGDDNNENVGVMRLFDRAEAHA